MASPRKNSILREPLYGQPGHLLRRAQQISASIFNDEIGPVVTPIQYAILCVLLTNPGIDQVSLAGLAAIDTSTAASVALRLEDKGLLTRRVDPRNRRQRILQLTDAGEALRRRHAALQDLLIDADAAAYAPPDPEALGRLRALYRRMLLRERGLTQPGRT